MPWRAYGAAAIGLAFQVVDDILDATAGLGHVLGKTAGKDAADANKPTYVSILGHQESRRSAQRSCAQDAHAVHSRPFGA